MSTYRRYPHQMRAQPAHLEITPESAEFVYNAEIGNSVPESVWSGRTLWVPCSNTLSDAACAQLLTEYAALIARVQAGQAGLGNNWDGHSHAGILTEDALAALADLTTELDYTTGDLNIREPSEWFALQSLNLDTKLTDAGISALAEILRAAAVWDGITLDEADESVEDVIRMRMSP